MTVPLIKMMMTFLSFWLLIPMILVESMLMSKKLETLMLTWLLM